MGNRQTEKQNMMRAPFWRSRLAALAMLSVVSAAAVTVLVLHMQSFTVRDGAKRYVVSTLSGDPAEAVRLAGVSVGEDDAITRLGDGNELTIDRAFTVSVTVDGEVREVRMTSGTVGDALERAGVDMAGYRLVNAQFSDAASDGLDICLVSAVTYNEYTETEPIPCQTQVQYTTALAKGCVKILQPGSDGQIVRTYRETLEDGVVVSRVVLSETRTEPTPRIQQVGTQLGVAMSPAPRAIALDAAGQPVNYSQVFTGTCTAYTNDRGLAGTHTSTGRVAAVGVVAVDPRIIPYGSELYIVSADGSYVYGYAIAGDTGGAARAGRIVADLFMNTYEECILFGRRPMNVYVLN